MSEDRSQAPSKRRRELAKERGIVARSPELTASVGLLASLALLGAFGPGLRDALIAGLRSSRNLTEIGSFDATALVAMLRGTAWSIAGPLGAIVGGTFAAMMLAHQIQVGGLWAPTLLTPDLGRLWNPDASFGSRLARGGWSLAKALLIAVVAGWTLRLHWPELTRSTALNVLGLAHAGAELARGVILPTAAATLALGAIDFLAQIARIERVLGMTADEHREESRAIDGDPNARSRRRRIAQSWRTDSNESLAGASLILLGPAGLTLVLSGNPPPGKIDVRAIARGASGASLRRAAGRAAIPLIEAPSLARYLSSRRVAGASLPADLAEELARIWPSPARRT